MIFIDFREPKEIASYLEKKNVCYTIKHLVVGDYVIKDIFIERKTWSDFLLSYASGRLFKQMLQLYQQKNAVLILEGFHFDSIARIEGFYSILTQIVFRYHIKIIFTLNPEHTAGFLIALERTMQDNCLKEPIKLIPIQNISLEQQKKRILFCFPTIGNKKANTILKTCPSLRTLFTATDQQLSTYGIGKKGQKAFEDILDR